MGRPHGEGARAVRDEPTAASPPGLWGLSGRRGRGSCKARGRLRARAEPGRRLSSADDAPRRGVPTLTHTNCYLWRLRSLPRPAERQLAASPPQSCPAARKPGDLTEPGGLRANQQARGPRTRPPPATQEPGSRLRLPGQGDSRAALPRASRPSRSRRVPHIRGSSCVGCRVCPAHELQPRPRSEPRGQRRRVGRSG